MRRLLLPLGLVLAAIPGIAQLDRGSITGSISDRTGAVIPDVRVVVQNMGNGALWRAETNQVGQYNVPNLPAGMYEVTFEAGGFRKLVKSKIELNVSDVVRVDGVLDVGAVSDSVQVTAEISKVQTDSPEVGTDMSHHQLVDLPLSFDGKRTAEDFAYKLTPGVTGDNWQSHINGSTDFSKETIVDGASVTTNRGGDSQGGPSIEAMQEYKVQTSGISAEYGRVQAGVFNYVMKSGQNQLHGSGFAEFRDAALNANTFVNNYRGRPRDLNSKQDWAGSFGGPVYIPKVYDGRNKTFFYVAYERYRQRQDGFGAPSVTAPLPEFYNGDFSRILGPVIGTDALGNSVAQNAIYDPLTLRQLDNGRYVAEMFPGNKIPASRISGVSKNINSIMQKYYMPTIKDASGQIALVNNMVYPSSREPINDQHQFSIKGDQNISDKQKLSGFWSWGSNPRMDTPGGLWSQDFSDGGPFSRAQNLQQIHQYYRVNHDYTFGPRLLNHVTLSANRFTNQVYNVNEGIDGATELGIKGMHTLSYPVINWGGGPIYSLANPGDTQNTFIAYTSYGFQDTVSFYKGRHFMKAGVDIRRNLMNYRLSQGGALNFNPVQTGIPNEAFSSKVGYSFASYLLGQVYSASLDDPRPTGDRRHYYAAYFQDDFKVSDRLTLNLGMRWDYQPPGWEVNNLLASWTPAERDPLSGMMGAYQFAGDCQMCTGRSYFGQKTYTNFGPRVGLAWRAYKDFTIRAAYGIFYEGDFFGGLSTTFLGKATSIQSGGTWSLNPDPITPWTGLFNWDSQSLPANRYTPPVFDRSWGDKNWPGMIDPNYGKMPYIQQWNFNIQKQVAKNTVVDIGYIGNKATRLKNADLNAMNQIPWSDVMQYGQQLSAPVRSAADAQKFGIAYPFPGFAGTLTGALRQYPQVYGTATIWTYGSPLGFSTYNALEAVVNHEFGHGLTVYANYTWSKNLTNTKTSANNNGGPVDYYNLANEKSVGAYDIPQMFKAYFQYDLPVGRGKILGINNRVLNTIAGGWSISGILNYFSGTPMGFGALTWPIGWNGGDRANVLPGALTVPFDKSKFDLANTKDPSNRYLDTSKIQDPGAYALGTSAPRYTQARTLGTINEDFGLLKNVQLREGYRLQFRGEFLNAFNRHVIDGLNTRYGNPLFGQMTGVDGNRTVQLGARFDF